MLCGLFNPEQMPTQYSQIISQTSLAFVFFLSAKIFEILMYRVKRQKYDNHQSGNSNSDSVFILIIYLSNNY